MKWPSGLRRYFKAHAIGMRGFESRSGRILLSKISVEPIGLEASAAGVVTGFPKRDNIFEGNPLARIKPAESSPNPRSGMLDTQRVVGHVRQLDQAISLCKRIPYSIARTNKEGISTYLLL